MHVRDSHLSIPQWQDLIDRAHAGDVTEPLINVDEAAGSHFQAIFVGGGGAGRFGAAIMRGMGGRALIVDRWPFLGGSCPHQACVPHHLFSDIAKELDLAKALEGTLWYDKFDPERASLREIVSLFRDNRSGAHAHMNWQSAEQLDIEYVTNAEAEILDARTVRVGDRIFTADALVLATGARTNLPGLPGEDLEGVFDFATLIEDLDYEPRSVVVIGGGKVAVEYGSFFNALGKNTTIVSRSDVLSSPDLANLDGDVRAFVVDNMRERDLTLLENTSVRRIVGVDRVESVEVETAAGIEVIPADFVLLATGERANLETFDGVLPVELTDRGFVKVDARMQTSVPGVYAVGDLIGPPMEMFKARKSGMAAARNIMGVDYELDLSDYPDFLHTTYEVTWAGISEAEARSTYPRVVTIQVPPPEVAPADTPLPMAEGSMIYAFTMPERSGYQKCVIDADSRRIVGIHHAGYGAKDAFQYLHYLMRRPGGITLDEIGELNELFLNSETFIQYGRLRASRSELVGM